MITPNSARRKLQLAEMAQFNTRQHQEQTKAKCMEKHNTKMDHNKLSKFLTDREDVKQQTEKYNRKQNDAKAQQKMDLARDT